MSTFYIYVLGSRLPHSGYFFSESIHLPANFMVSFYFKVNWVGGTRMGGSGGKGRGKKIERGSEGRIR